MIEVILGILSVLLIPLLAFLGKIAYDYGSLKTTTQHILDKLDKFIESNDGRIDDIEEEMKWLRTAVISIITKLDLDIKIKE